MIKTSPCNNATTWEDNAKDTIINKIDITWGKNENVKKRKIFST